VSTADIGGGDYGSATVNQRGELVRCHVSTATTVQTFAGFRGALFFHPARMARTPAGIKVGILGLRLRRAALQSVERKFTRLLFLCTSCIWTMPGRLVTRLRSTLFSEASVCMRRR